MLPIARHTAFKRALEIDDIGIRTLRKEGCLSEEPNKFLPTK